ncbi:MAG: PAS domain-containing protein, partial [Anaerolineae bacterium]
MNPTQYFENLWQQLTRPHPSLEYPDAKRQARLLTSLLILFVGLTLVSFVLSVEVSNQRRLVQYIELGLIFLVLIGLSVIYRLSRSPYYKLAARLAVILTFLGIYTSIIVDSSVIGGYAVYLVVVVLLSGLLLSLRTTIIIAILSTLPLLILWGFLRQDEILYSILFLAFVNTLLVLSIHHRNQLEADHQQELQNRMADGKKIHDELQRTTQRLSTLIENLQDGVLVENEHRKIVLVNEAFCKLFMIAVSPQLLIGNDCREATESSGHLFVDPNFNERVDAIL